MAAVRFEPKGIDCLFTTKEAIGKGATFGYTAEFSEGRNKFKPNNTRLRLRLRLKMEVTPSPI
jgi:hypothetical protein